MSTFDQTTFVADGKFRIVELDSTGEGGKFNLPIEIGQEAELVSVLIEGEFMNVEPLIRNEPFELNNETTFMSERGEHVLYTQINPAGNQLQLRGSLEAGRRAKISVLVLYRRIRDRAWGLISCAACKKLIRFLIKAMFTGGADAVPDILGDVIPGEFWDWVGQGLGENMHLPDAVQAILDGLDQSFVQRFKNALRESLDVLRQLYEPIDRALTFICGQLGLCPKEAQ